MPQLRSFIVVVPFLLALAWLGCLPVGERSLSSETASLACSAVGMITPEIVSDVTHTPDRIADWYARLLRFGDVLGILVPFSRAPGSTSLGRPRVLLALGHPFTTDKHRDPYPAKRDLSHRLYLGVTTAPNHTQTLEFISWNQSSRRYDFGVIESFETPANRHLVFNDAKRAECLACHRTAGPIFPVFPWTGFGVDPLFSVAMIEEAYHRDPKHFRRLYDALQTWKERAEGSIGRLRFGITDPKYRNDPEARLLREGTLFLNGKDTGVHFFEEGESDRTAAFDGAVRNGNTEVSLPNQIINALPATARPSAARIVVTRSLLQPYGEFAPDILSGFPAYLERQQKALRAAVKVSGGEELPASRPSQIRDFDPVSGMPNHHPIATSDDHLSYVETIVRYNEKREAGELGVPEKFRPSAAPAFLSANVPPSYTLPAAVAAGVPGVVGLFEGDLEPLFQTLESSGKGGELLRAAIESTEMNRVLQHGIPNRETLLAALYAGARAEWQRRKLSASAAFDPGARIPPLGPCDGAGNAPSGPVSAARSDAACARCHVGPDKIGRMHFPFDPEDRDAWKEALADPNRRDATHRFLVKVVRRLDNGSMPPDESPERTMLEKKPRRAAELKILLDYLHRL